TQTPSKTMTLLDSTFMLDHPTSIANEQSDAAHLGVDVEAVLCAIRRFVGSTGREPRCRQWKQKEPRPAQQPRDLLRGRHELEPEGDRAEPLLENAPAVPKHGGHRVRSEPTCPRFAPLARFDRDFYRRVV